MVEYLDAVCPRCGSGGAVLIPASQVGWLFDWILCYGCGEASVVEGLRANMAQLCGADCAIASGIN